MMYLCETTAAHCGKLTETNLSANKNHLHDKHLVNFVDKPAIEKSEVPIGVHDFVANEVSSFENEVGNLDDLLGDIDISNYQQLVKALDKELPHKGVDVDSTLSDPLVYKTKIMQKHTQNGKDYPKTGFRKPKLNTRLCLTKSNCDTSYSKDQKGRSSPSPVAISYQQQEFFRGVIPRT
ncbi:hypothetical protein WDU94_006822 [Cyamophila willieti]